jgi:hypothetical protein
MDYFDLRSHGGPMVKWVHGFFKHCKVEPMTLTDVSYIFINKKPVDFTESQSITVHERKKVYITPQVLEKGRSTPLTINWIT